MYHSKRSNGIAECGVVAVLLVEDAACCQRKIDMMYLSIIDNCNLFEYVRHDADKCILTCVRTTDKRKSFFLVGKWSVGDFGPFSVEFNLPEYVRHAFYRLFPSNKMVEFFHEFGCRFRHGLFSSDVGIRHGELVLFCALAFGQ